MNILMLLVLSSLTGFLIYIFNQFVKHENRVKEAWSGIDVQLKLRHDLVPNLVELVKRYTKHEQEVLVETVEKRVKTNLSNRAEEVNNDESALTQSLKTLFAVVENYPDLKADGSFLELQENLVKIEDQLQHARRYYNGSVRDYNTIVQSFPNNLLANILSKKEKAFFELERSIERETPKVNL